MKNLLILGSTGSIGLSTLDVISRNAKLYKAWGLTANSNAKLIIEQIRTYQPKYVAMADASAAKVVADFVLDSGIDTKVYSGAQALSELSASDEVDVVMAAIVGAAGLAPTIEAAKAGKRILLANKEALVCSGQLFMDAVEQGGAELMPVDSEHNAIFQCLPANKSGFNEQSNLSVKKILLTGSGGPFRGRSLDSLADVTPEQACAHPNWSMGRKISVDSATMMNKGLEFIEACWLFDTKPEDVDIVLHPQSVIHSMVQYVDGSVLAQMGNPDMRTPIAHALSWPERIESGVDNLDFSSLSLDFHKPDLSIYPCLSLALDCANILQSAPTILNAANEIAVEAFLNREIGFLDIAKIIDKTLGKSDFWEPTSIEEVLSIDFDARKLASEHLSLTS